MPRRCRRADFRDTIDELRRAHPRIWRDAIRMWHDHWIDIAAPEIAPSVRLLRALRRRGVPVMALSNFGIGTWDRPRPATTF